MKNLLNFIKTKLLMFVFALVLPLSATGLALSLSDFEKANADSNTTSYYNNYTDEVSMTNSNFNSGSSNYSLSTSLTGWTGQISDKKTTAGIISVGPTFQTYMSSTYHLSKNPSSARTIDKYILMINSQIKDSGSYDTARQGYKSNSLSLDANSYYSFQVSFKSDTNYTSHTEYDLEGTISETGKYFGKTSFTASDKAFLTNGDPVYLSLTYRSATYYVKKALTAHGALAADRDDLTTDQLFYEDANYIGFIDTDNTPIYVAKTDYNSNRVEAGAETYVCDLTYNPTNERYEISVGTEYFKARTAYTSLNDYTFGSVYLSGLKDEDGNDISTANSEFVAVSSKEWTTYYIFVATGSKSQNVNLELWLGTKENGHNSSGVVFFDDCHVYQYSENAFWAKYKTHKNKTYTQEVVSGGITTTETRNCTKLENLKDETSADYDGYNFDFETEPTAEPVVDWTKTGSGDARVFNVNAPEYFKSTTGYDFLGSDMTCKVDTNGELSITKNQYVLGLWANNNSVKVSSKPIDVEANAVYKVKAYYKVSEISSGNAYLSVEENDVVRNYYNLAEEDYTLATKQQSSALSSNGSNKFINNYNSVEFYIKGNSRYNSSVTLALELGTETENAKGCIVFDNISIERASYGDFESASNKITLGSTSSGATITNGFFDDVSADKDTTYPLKALNWDNESSDDFTFAGVINTRQEEYSKYFAKYNEYNAEVDPTENPYYWAYSSASPKNSYNSTTDSDNVYMLANIENAWQTLKSSAVSLSADTIQKISFNFKAGAPVNAKIYDSNGILLYEAKNLTTGGVWKTYEIYLKAFTSANDVYVQIEFGTKTNKVQGFAYFDNFAYTSVSEEVFNAKAENAAGNEDVYGLVDLSNFYLNLPSTDLSDGSESAYTGTSTGSSNHGEIVKAEDLTSTFEIAEADKNVFFFNNQVVGSYSITSKYELELTEGYHKLSFKVKTHFSTPADELDSDKDYNYGVNVGLTGFDYMKNIRCDDDYETYTIYLHTTETTKANLYLVFVSDTNETRGSAVIYDIALEKSESADDYNAANETCKDKNYDLNTDRIFVAKASESSGEEETPSTDDETDKNTSSNSTLDWSLIISGIITGAAIILAVVFSVMKHIKVKKIEVKRKESYDRKTSLELNAIRKRAEAQQKKEAENIQSSVDKLQAELDSLEKEHKQKVVELREKDQGKVSKATDKEFKDFARKRTVLAEKISSLNEQIATIKSPEYLLTLERKIFTKDEVEKRELSRQSKVKNKQMEKASKEKDSKNNK